MNNEEIEEAPERSTQPAKYHARPLKRYDIYAKYCRKYGYNLGAYIEGCPVPGEPDFDESQMQPLSSRTNRNFKPSEKATKRYDIYAEYCREYGYNLGAYIEGCPVPGEPDFDEGQMQPLSSRTNRDFNPEIS